MGVSRWVVHAWGGLLLVLATSVLLFVPRARVATLPWLDEHYTIIAVESSAPRILELCAADAHPPGYYFLLKLWLKPFRLAGAEPGSFTARLHGLAWRSLALAIVWFAGRRAFGAVPAAAMAWLLCLSPRLLEAAAELRQYSVFAPLLPALFALMMAAWSMQRDAARETLRGRIAATWAAYAILAAICLWCHYLAGFALFALGIAWICLSASMGRRAIGSPFVLGGAIAQGFAVAAFVPWVDHVAGNYRYMMWAHPDMAAATLPNLYLCATGWMPFGSEFDCMAPPLRDAASAAGLAGSAVPLLAALALAAMRRTGMPQDAKQARRAGVAALAIGAGLVFAFWLLARLGVVWLFHAPRYPIAGLGIWIAGLALLAFSTGLRPRLAVLLLAPWIAVSAAGLARALTVEPHTVHFDPVAARRDVLPPPGEPIYVMPSEFIPYIESDYGDWPLLPVEAIRDHGPGDATVLRATPWMHIVKARDSSLDHAMRHRVFSESVDVFRYPETAVMRLHGTRPAILAQVGTVPWEEFRKPSVGRAASDASPEMQNPPDGGYSLEYEDEDLPVRRAVASPAIARFDRPLEPGRYILRIAGSQWPFPRPRTTWRFRFPGEPGTTVVDVSEREFDVRIPVELTRRHDAPSVAIERPTWVPADCIEGSQDLRPFSFTLRGLWMEKAPPS